MPSTTLSAPNHSRALNARYSARSGVFICRSTGAYTIITNPPVISVSDSGAKTNFEYVFIETNINPIPKTMPMPSDTKIAVSASAAPWSACVR